MFAASFELESLCRRPLLSQVQALCAPGFVGEAKVQSCDKDLGEYKCLGALKAYS